MTTVPEARRRPGRLGPTFRVFQSSVLCSDLADGIYRIAVPLLGLSMPDPALAVVAAGVAIRAPWLLAILPAGVVADRHDPLRLMHWCSWVRLPIIAVLALLAWVSVLPLWGLVLGAFLVSTAGAVVDIAAQSLVPTLVDRSLLPRANANIQSGQTIMLQFAGPAAGGLLATHAGSGIGAAAALYVGTLGGLELLRRMLAADRVTETVAPEPRRQPQRRADRTMLGELRGGARYFRTRRDLMALAAVAASGNLGFAAITTILPLWVVAPGRLDLPETALGLILSAPAVGGLLAGVVAGRALERVGGARMAQCCAPAIGLSFLAIAVPNPFVIYAAFACYGALAVSLNVMNMTHRQTTVPAELFGRANSMHRWITLGVTPIGALLGGVLAHQAGIQATFVTAGAIAAMAGLTLALRISVLDTMRPRST